jgi:hypothetical protein
MKTGKMKLDLRMICKLEAELGVTLIEIKKLK